MRARHTPIRNGTVTPPDDDADEEDVEEEDEEDEEEEVEREEGEEDAVASEDAGFRRFVIDSY